MLSKTNIAVTAWQIGNKNLALKIFSSFRLNLTKDEQSTLKTAYEISTGKEQFYKALNLDTDNIVVKAEQIINQKFINIGNK